MLRKATTYLNPNLMFIWYILMNERGRYYARLTLVCVLLGAALQTAAPYGIGLIVDAFGSQEWSALRTGLTIFLGIELLAIVIGWFRQRIRERLFQQNFWFLPMQLTTLFFARSAGQLIEEDSEIDGGGVESLKDKVWSLIGSYIFSIIPNYALALFAVTACVLVSPLIGLAAMVYMAIDLTLGYRQNAIIHVRMKPIVDDFRRWERRTREWWHATPLIKNNGVETRVINQVRDDIQPTLAEDDKVWRIYFSTAVAKRRLFGLLVALVIYAYVGWLVMQNQLGVAESVLVFFSFERIRVVLSDIIDQQREVQYQLTAIDKYRLVLSEPVPFRYNEGIPFADNAIGIRFDRVSLTLGKGGSRRDILKEVSFTISPGERIGIVGPSGAGKTQLLSLMVRGSDPSTGTIFINSHDLRMLELQSLLRFYGIIPQKSDPFEDTVIGNVTFSVSHLDRFETVPSNLVTMRVEEALHKAGLDFEGRLTEGLNTKLGYKGMRLSGGQQARLRIADAHYKLAYHQDRPRLILADEPTASLDSLSETKVLEHLTDELPSGTTVVMIAHRLSTVASMDRIMFVRPLELCGVSDTQVTLHKSLAELYASEPLFREMADAQGFKP